MKQAPGHFWGHSQEAKSEKASTEAILHGLFGSRWPPIQLVGMTGKRN
jgi:hypothetical protein